MYRPPGGGVQGSTCLRPRPCGERVQDASANTSSPRASLAPLAQHLPRLGSTLSVQPRGHQCDLKRLPWALSHATHLQVTHVWGLHSRTSQAQNVSFSCSPGGGWRPRPCYSPSPCTTANPRVSPFSTVHQRLHSGHMRRHIKGADPTFFTPVVRKVPGTLLTERSPEAVEGGRKGGVISATHEARLPPGFSREYVQVSGLGAGHCKATLLLERDRQSRAAARSSAAPLSRIAPLHSAKSLRLFHCELGLEQLHSLPRPSAGPSLGLKPCPSPSPTSG